MTFGQTKKALLDVTRDDMLQIIGMASTQFTRAEADQVLNLLPGQEDTPEFITIKTKLQQIRALSPNIENFYIMKIDEQGIIFLVDDLEDVDYARIGQVYEDPESMIFDAVNGPRVSDNIYTDEWGTFLSGYAPLIDSTGKPSLIIGGDMKATMVIQRQNFIGNTIYIIMGIAVLIAAGIIGLFSVTIIRDINKLKLAANKISMGDTDISIDVRRKDEIGDLAESFGRMVASLKIMMTNEETQSINGDPSQQE